MSGYDDPFWTLEQAIAWILLRKREPVERASARMLSHLKKGDHLREYSRRHGSQMTPFFIACENPLAKYFPGFPDCDIDNKDNYTRELLDALSAGHVIANAWSRQEEIRKLVEPLYWLDHTIGCDEQGILSDRGPAPRYVSNLADIRITAADVRRHWAETLPAAKLTASAEKASFKKLRTMMSESPDKQPAPKKSILANFQADFPGLAEEGFNRAWKEALKAVNPPGWGRRGRPRKESSKIEEAKTSS